MVDQLDEEAVGECVERLRDVHRDGYGSARGLALIEARDHPSRDGEQGRGGGMPRFEATLGGVSAQSLHERCWALIPPPMGYHLVNKEAIGSGGVIGQAYGVEVGLEPQAVAGQRFVRLCQLEGEWP